MRAGTSLAYPAGSANYAGALVHLRAAEKIFADQPECVELGEVYAALAHANDEGRKILTYSWSLIEPAVASVQGLPASLDRPTLDVTFSAPGVYRIRLDVNDGTSWRARPDAELHATMQKGLMDLDSDEQPKGSWPVYKGESFDLWNPDTGSYYAWADPDQVVPFLFEKRLRGAKLKDSAHHEFPLDYLRRRETLVCNAPRIVFRDVTNRENYRTVVAALIPAKTFVTNTAPTLLWPRGDEYDKAYLLGILCSLPLDWYARRFVERHLNFFIFNPLPVPRPRHDSLLRQLIIAAASRLSAPDKRFAKWATSLEVECGPIDEAQKDDLVYEIDAAVAHLYGLSEAQLVHIFETFHEKWDYHDRLDATLKRYRKLAGKKG